MRTVRTSQHGEPNAKFSSHNSITHIHTLKAEYLGGSPDYSQNYAAWASLSHIHALMILHIVTTVWDAAAHFITLNETQLPLGGMGAH